jgi:hypothetical protein
VSKNKLSVTVRCESDGRVLIITWPDGHKHRPPAGFLKTLFYRDILDTFERNGFDVETLELSILRRASDKRPILRPV